LKLNYCNFKGNYYLGIEYVGIIYRCLIPVHPWILFLLHTDNTNDDTLGNSTFFPIVLCILYGLFKLNNMYNLYTEATNAFCQVFSHNVRLSSVVFLLRFLKHFKLKAYGISVSRSEIDENSACPICQDRFTDPIKLKCQVNFF